MNLAGTDMAAAKVKRSFPGTQIGADTGPTLYVQKLFDMRLGSPQRKYVWDPDTLDFVAQLLQKYATTFQVTGVFKEAPNYEGFDASDLANEAAAYLQNDAALDAFWFVGLGVERVTQVRNPPFTDGQDQYEFLPNFDFVLTHDQITLSRTPSAVGTELRIARV
jgi:hypothetical protein